MNFLDDIESNAESYLRNKNNMGLSTNDIEYQQDNKNDGENPFSESTLHRVIKVARHIHTEYQKHVEQTNDWRRSVQRELNQANERNKDKKLTDKMTIHSTADFQKRIQELQFDLREREDRLKDCREKIIELKRGNIVL